MLKAVRIILALLSFAAVCLLFVDVNGYAAAHWGWMAKIQLVPALLALNLGVVAVLALCTLLFGRVYCSIVCPLGVYQDFINSLRGRIGKKKKRKNRFRFKPENTKLRYGFFSVFVVLLVLGLLGVVANSFAGMLDPYSSFGRIMGQLIVPGARAGIGTVAQNVAADGYFFLDSVPLPSPLSFAVMAVAVVSLLVVTVMAWRGGRDYCNTVCPVGSVLGFISRYALLRINIDTDKCNGCGKCGRNCKASCIDTKNHEIDLSRCVVCMDCIGNCSQNAISFSRVKKVSSRYENAPDKGRRLFLAASAFVAGSAAMKAADKTTDGGLEPLQKKHSHSGILRAVPAGSASLEHLSSVCTACQLCVSACPNGVLKPTADFEGFMQPHMVFTQGYCRPDCTVCSDVCPAGAIKPISVEEKAVTKIGTAHVDASICISASQGVDCGSCSRHCPAGAITMVGLPDGNLRPVVDEGACIGCGSCEYHCPVGNVVGLGSKTAAIYVEGIEQHRKIVH